VDLFVLRKERTKALAGVDEEFASELEDDREPSAAYLSARQKASNEPLVIEYSKSFFPVLALVFVVRSFLFEPFQIPSESMVPTLEVGDFIVVNKFSYGIRLPLIRTKVLNISSPKRGDVMVFFPPHDERYFIKRVIGLPGDRIQYINHQLYINDQKVEIDFDSVTTDLSRPFDACSTVFKGSSVMMTEMLDDKTFRSRKCTVPGQYSLSGTWIVPNGHYFMMGDNRDNSLDSRDWGFVPERNVVGKAVAIWMHWEKIFSLPSFGRAGAIN
jgi:signal peptidase I